jgi:hypothetical protein
LVDGQLLEGKAGLADCVPEGSLANSGKAEFAASSVSGASSQIRAVHIKYKDHVFFRNISSPAAEAVIREVLGWVRTETDEALLVECDRPLVDGCSGFNGVVILKSCIVSMVELPLQGFPGKALNCSANRNGCECCASSQRSEKLSPKTNREGRK